MYGQQNVNPLAQNPMLLASLQSMMQRQPSAAPIANPSPLAGVQRAQSAPQMAYAPIMPGAFSANNGNGGVSPSLLSSLLGNGGGSGKSGLLSGIIGPSAGSAGGQYASLLGGSKAAGNAMNAGGTTLADLLANGSIAM